ncbi:Set1/Ash2 histone methyltransferase complex subunit ASH2 [Physocladia obscura]|uniref:Set1/Ash2 histone methyltransferase complex subunit ASH2 n=1 Tax=Physocladia obscura TaxID=109957 RepID=A0AAD5T9K1_9FUNG|nr:Set1/Ash2 histone methyltransferase complex subunit ASH2 [Physocladia obscura]
MPMSMALSHSSNERQQQHQQPQQQNQQLQTQQRQLQLQQLQLQNQQKVQFLPIPMNINLNMAIPVQNGFLVPASQIPIQMLYHTPQQQQQQQQQYQLQQHQQQQQAQQQQPLQSHFQSPQNTVAIVAHREIQAFSIRHFSVENATNTFIKTYFTYVQDCIESLKSWKNPPFLGDDFFVFTCKQCTSHKMELILRQSFTFVDIVYIVLFQFTYAQLIPASWNLTWSRETPTLPPLPKIGPSDGRMYFMKRQVAAFVDVNWERFWLKDRSRTWTHSLMTSMQNGGTGASLANSTEDARFLSGKDQFPADSGANMLISLFNKNVYASMIESKRARSSAYDISPVGTLVDLPGSIPRLSLGKTVDGNAVSGVEKKETGKRLLETSGIAGNIDSDSESVASNRKATGGHSTPELRIDSGENKKKRIAIPRPKRIERRLEPEEVDVSNSILLYPDLNNPENGPVVLSSELTHTAPQMKISVDGLTVFTDKGYRMSKATHGVYEGCWYYEVTFHSKEKGHARVGWSQISGDLQAPCGYDKFSYSFRDFPGTLFHESVQMRSKDGDVLGLMITLPSQSDVDNLVRRLWSVDASYVQFRTKPLQKLDSSEIRYFKNGKELGVAFTNLYNGKYYPAVSSYQYGTLTLNFGPNFAYPLPTGARAYSDVPKVFAWSEYAMYSYEPFIVYDKEFTTAITAAAAPSSGSGSPMLSPQSSKRDIIVGLFGKRKKPKKKLGNSPLLAIQRGKNLSAIGNGGSGIGAFGVGDPIAVSSALQNVTYASDGESAGKDVIDGDEDEYESFGDLI